MKLRNVLFAAVLAVSPLTSSLAQQTTMPDVKAGSAKEANEVKNGAATTPTQPGATGSSKVTGDHSTVAGDQQATDRVKGGGGGGGK